MNQISESVSLNAVDGRKSYPWRLYLEHYAGVSRGHAQTNDDLLGSLQGHGVGF